MILALNLYGLKHQSVNFFFFFFLYDHETQFWEPVTLHICTVLYFCKDYSRLVSLDYFKMAQNQKVDFNISSKNSPSFEKKQSHVPWFWVSWEAGGGTPRQIVFCSENFCSMAVGQWQICGQPVVLKVTKHTTLPTEQKKLCLVTCLLIPGHLGFEQCWAGRVGWGSCGDALQVGRMWPCSAAPQWNPRLCVSSGKWSALLR